MTLTKYNARYESTGRFGSEIIQNIHMTNKTKLALWKNYGNKASISANFVDSINFDWIMINKTKFNGVLANAELKINDKLETHRD